jgi:hypothetical protein
MLRGRERSGDGGKLKLARRFVVVVGNEMEK